MPPMQRKTETTHLPRIGNAVAEGTHCPTLSPSTRRMQIMNPAPLPLPPHPASCLPRSTALTPVAISWMPWIGSRATESCGVPHLRRSSPLQALCFTYIGARSVTPFPSFSQGVLLPSAIYAAAAAPTAAWASFRSRRAAGLLPSGHPALLALSELTVKGSGVGAPNTSLLRMSGHEGAEGGAPHSATTGPDTAAMDKSKVGKGAFPTVTMDADAVQKFAEIEVPWGEQAKRKGVVVLRFKNKYNNIKQQLSGVPTGTQTPGAHDLQQQLHTT